MKETTKAMIIKPLFGFAAIHFKPIRNITGESFVIMLLAAISITDVEFEKNNAAK